VKLKLGNIDLKYHDSVITFLKDMKAIMFSN